jgi:hypothetical protein
MALFASLNYFLKWVFLQCRVSWTIWRGELAETAVDLDYLGGGGGVGWNCVDLDYLER